MTEVPRVKRATPGTRTKTLLTTLGEGLTAGGLRAAAPVPPRTASVTGIRAFAIVEHGDDPNFTRPVALIVFWLGAATPANSERRDFWYPANDF